MGTGTGFLHVFSDAFIRHEKRLPNVAGIFILPVRFCICLPMHVFASFETAKKTGNDDILGNR